MEQRVRPWSWPFLSRLVERSVREFFDDQCPHLAASIAYRVLFSLFPLAIVLAGIFGLVVDATGLQTDVVDAIVRNVPLSEEGRADLERLLERSTRGLGALGLLGLVGLVWAASGMMAAIRVALNLAWDVEQPRPFLQGKALDVLLVFGVSVVVVLSFGLTVTTRIVEAFAVDVLEEVGVGVGGAVWLLGVGAPFVLALVATTFLYRVVPGADPRLREVLPAAVFVAGAFALLQNLFALYVSNFGNYNEVYGSLGAVIAFLLFVYIASAVFLLGAEVAAEWPRVRRELEHGVEEEDGEPLSEQVKGLLRGLVVRPDERDETRTRD